MNVLNRKYPAVFKGLADRSARWSYDDVVLFQIIRIRILAGIREDSEARTGSPKAIRRVVVRSTRHVSHDDCRIRSPDTRWKRILATTRRLHCGRSRSHSCPDVGASVVRHADVLEVSSSRRRDVGGDKLGYRSEHKRQSCWWRVIE